MKKRRAAEKFIGSVVLGLLSVFAFVGDLTGNQGLWTMGGLVGMARPTYLCFGFVAYVWFQEALDLFNGDYPFRKAD